MTTYSKSRRVTKTSNGKRTTTTYTPSGISRSRSMKLGNQTFTSTILANGGQRFTTTTHCSDGTSLRKTNTYNPSTVGKRKKSKTNNSESSSVINYSSGASDIAETEPIVYLILFILGALLFGIVAGKVMYVLTGFAVLGGIYGFGKWFFREREIPEEPKEESNRLLGFAVAAVILCVTIPFIDMIVRAF